jgi:metallo-beta-lactamase class B
MFGKTVLLAWALVACTATPALAAPNKEGKALAKACKGRDGWADAAPPARIFGNTYYVGTCGITVLLLTSPRGHVLIDSGPAEAVPSVLANVRKLGFEITDIKLIIGSHEHIDHMGGFAALKAATGAKIFVRQPARAVLESGRADPADPQAGLLPDMTPITVDSVVDKDWGIFLEIDRFRIDQIATPGHTAGGTSWTWQSCEAGRCLAFAYIDSLSAVSRDGYRFADHPERVAPFRRTFKLVEAMKCDVLITPHPGVSNLFERLTGKIPLVDPAACRLLATASSQKLDARLAKEAAK